MLCYLVIYFVSTFLQVDLGEISNSKSLSELQHHSSPAQESGDDTLQFESFLRRSPRRRVSIKKYISEDYRESPKSPRRRRGSKSLATSKRGSPKIEVDDEEFVKKREELETLKSIHFDAIQSEKMEDKKRRMEGRRLVMEQRRREREERARVKEEQRLHKEEVKDKLRLARTLLKEAQRDKLRRNREKEKIRKQKQLEELKQKKMAQKKKMQELVSVPAASTNTSEMRELPEEEPPGVYEAPGVTDLPELPRLSLDVPDVLLPRFLFVCEFLYTFADAMKLKRKLMAGSCSCCFEIHG